MEKPGKIGSLNKTESADMCTLMVPYSVMEADDAKLKIVANDV